MCLLVILPTTKGNKIKLPISEFGKICWEGGCCCCCQRRCWCLANKRWLNVSNGQRQMKARRPSYMQSCEYPNYKTHSINQRGRRRTFLSACRIGYEWLLVLLRPLSRYVFELWCWLCIFAAMDDQGWFVCLAGASGRVRTVVSRAEDMDWLGWDGEWDSSDWMKACPFVTPFSSCCSCNGMRTCPAWNSSSYMQCQWMEKEDGRKKITSKMPRGREIVSPIDNPIRFQFYFLRY